MIEYLMVNCLIQMGPCLQPSRVVTILFMPPFPRSPNATASPALRFPAVVNRESFPVTGTTGNHTLRLPRSRSLPAETASAAVCRAVIGSAPALSATLDAACSTSGRGTRQISPHSRRPDFCSSRWPNTCLVFVLYCVGSRQ